jgi:2'-5' RNA ligase
LNFADHALASHYDAMWQNAFPAIAAGDVAYDRYLLNKGCDPRRGLTLVARLDPRVSSRLIALLNKLAGVEPDQYYPLEADLHLTVLSLFTVTEAWKPHLAHLDGYRAAVAEALEAARPFAVDTAGLTLSRSAVIAQGFPHDDMLGEIRDRLRGALARRGLDGTLDQRYRLVTAHSTLMRFRTPLRDPQRFAECLAALREEVFGTSVFDTLYLVFNDWYMSSQTLRTLDAYALGL